MLLRFTDDASVPLHTEAGLVTVTHTRGEEVEVPDEIGRLFLASGSAFRVKRPTRTDALRGEIRCSER